MQNEALIADFLKKNDKERYYSSLILNKKHRSAVQSLFAFNAEISAISLQVSEAQIGEIRLVWWREVIEGKRKEEAKNNPVSANFLEIIKEYNLPSVPLIRLIEARYFDLYNDKMPNMQTFEGYAGETNSILYQYFAMILNDGKQLENGDAAGHVGVAHALIGHIFSFGFNANRGKIFLPISVFNENGVSETQILNGENDKKLDAAMNDLISQTKLHLDKAKTAIKKLSKNTRPAFAFIAVLDKQITLLEKHKSNYFQAPKKLQNWRIILKLSFWS